MLTDQARIVFIKSCNFSSQLLQVALDLEQRVELLLVLRSCVKKLSDEAAHLDHILVGLSPELLRLMISSSHQELLVL